MSGIKQKSYARRQKKRMRRHKMSILGISAVILLLVVVVSVSSVTLRAKDKAYAEQESELDERLLEEKERSGQISDLEQYVQTDSYIEQIAREKLGLVHENEIIFKQNK